MLDAAGGVPLLRGAREASIAIARRAWWERRRAERLERGPARPTWPALAADRTPVGLDEVTNGTATATPRGRPPPCAARARHALPERESLELLRGGRPGRRRGAGGGRPGRAPPSRPRGVRRRPGRLKLDAVGLAHKSDVGAVRLGLVGRRRPSAPPPRSSSSSAGRRDLDVRGLLVEPMARPGLELIVGLTPRPARSARRSSSASAASSPRSSTTWRSASPRSIAAEALAMLDDLRGRRACSTASAAGRPSTGRPSPTSSSPSPGSPGERPDIVEVDLNPVIAGAGRRVGGRRPGRAGWRPRWLTAAVLRDGAHPVGRPARPRTGRRS